MLISELKKQEIINENPKLKKVGKNNIFILYKLKHLMINTCMGKLSVDKSKQV